MFHVPISFVSTWTTSLLSLLNLSLISIRPPPTPISFISQKQLNAHSQHHTYLETNPWGVCYCRNTRSKRIALHGLTTTCPGDHLIRSRKGKGNEQEGEKEKGKDRRRNAPFAGRLRRSFRSSQGYR